MNRFEYPVLLAPAEEGGFVVTCRDLPEVITQGENVTDALAEAVGEWRLSAVVVVVGQQRSIDR